MKRVLLTGAGGAIGVHMIAHIMHNTDWEIVALDSFQHKGYFDRITQVCKNHEDWRPRIEVFTHDLTAPVTNREVDRIGDIDYLINLASLSDVQGSIDDPTPFVRNNVELMLNILEYARLAEPEVFLHFSTDEVYGPVGYEFQDCEEETVCEDGNPKNHQHLKLKGHSEWDTVLPSNPYAASKACQEAIAISYWRSFGIPLIITNTMNNFGEMQGPTKYPAMIQKKLEAGENVTVHSASDGQIGTRYYLHSRNAADAVLFILRNLPPELHQPGHIDRPDRYNIVGDKQVSNLELAQTIADLMGRELDYELVDFHSKQPGHDLHYGLDGKKLGDLGWKSPISFEDSMEKTIEWQQENPEWMQ